MVSFGSRLISFRLGCQNGPEWLQNGQTYRLFTLTGPVWHISMSKLRGWTGVAGKTASSFFLHVTCYILVHRATILRIASRILSYIQLIVVRYRIDNKYLQQAYHVIWHPDCQPCKIARSRCNTRSKKIWHKEATEVCHVR